MSTEIHNKIDSILESHSIVLFMKGTKQFPQCGFSAQSVTLLQELDVDFFDVDVLSDENLRQGIKDYGNWPTIPQLYVNKKLIGGSDIMMELFESNQLLDTLKGNV